MNRPTSSQGFQVVRVLVVCSGVCCGSIVTSSHASGLLPCETPTGSAAKQWQNML